MTPPFALMALLFDEMPHLKNIHILRIYNCFFRFMSWGITLLTRIIIRHIHTYHTYYKLDALIIIYVIIFPWIIG